MIIEETKIEGLIIIRPEAFHDERGSFRETFSADRYKRAIGTDATFVQDNFSTSRRGVIRGLHFQKERPQGKLVSCLRGEVFDVVVDLRDGSTTYGCWESVVLSRQNGVQLFIPPGFAHGFQTISEEADFFYKCTAYYCPEDEGGIRWDDPELAIAWPTMNAVLSPKDESLGSFSSFAEK